MVKRLKTKACLSQLHILWIIKIDKILDFLLVFFNTFFLTLYDNFFPQFQPNIAINGKKIPKIFDFMAVLLDFFLTIYLYEDYFPNFNQISLKRVKKNPWKNSLFKAEIFGGWHCWSYTLMFLYTETEHHLFTHQTQHLVHINFIKKKSSLFHFALIITNSVIKNN